MKKKIIIIVAVMLLIVLGYSGYFLFAHNDSDALTVSELWSQAPSLHGKQVTVKGQVTPGTVKWDNQAKIITFIIKDNKDSLTVVYAGIAPDNFRPGAELVIEGTFSAGDVFEARSFGQPRSVCNLCH